MALFKESVAQEVDIGRFWMINKGRTVQIMQILNEAPELMVSLNVTPSKKQYGGTNPWIFSEKGL